MMTKKLTFNSYNREYNGSGGYDNTVKDKVEIYGYIEPYTRNEILGQFGISQNSKAFLILTKKPIDVDNEYYINIDNKEYRVLKNDKFTQGSLKHSEIIVGDAEASTIMNGGNLDG